MSVCPSVCLSVCALAPIRSARPCLRPTNATAPKAVSQHTPLVLHTIPKFHGISPKFPGTAREIRPQNSPKWPKFKIQDTLNAYQTATRCRRSLVARERSCVSAQQFLETSVGVPRNDDLKGRKKLFLIKKFNLGSKTGSVWPGLFLS